MNHLLETYLVDVDYPTVSGIEQLQMLETRTQLATLDLALSAGERQALEQADQTLLRHAEQVLVELQRFVDLAAERRERNIHPDWWWWYLDVIVKVPTFAQLAQNQEMVST